jgi:hypothetical protein
MVTRYSTPLVSARTGVNAMLVYERAEDFVFVEQDLHARLSGDLGAHWREELFSGVDRLHDVLFAVANHDHAWVSLDSRPLWNDGAREPYSFVSLPALLKIPAYQSGIDWTESRSKYAALLCSQHYVSFFVDAGDEGARGYYELERTRQNRLLAELGLDPGHAPDTEFHFRLQQFLDKLSLYICLNEPGVAKEGEFSWYREGFAHTDSLPLAGGRPINALWLDPYLIGLTAFPFAAPFEVSVPTRVVSKREISHHGTAEAYRQTPITMRTVELRPIPV